MSGHVRAGALQAPLDSTRVQRPSSVRRTTNIDISPDGPTSRDGIVLDGAARDRTCSGTGSVATVAAASVRAVVGPDRALVSLLTDPPAPALQPLIGTDVGAGFRARLRDLLDGQGDERTPLFLLIDDLPVAALIAGYADMYAGSAGPAPVAVRAPGEGAEIRSRQADICAGWAGDGVMLTALAETGVLPIPEGPPAPGLEGGYGAWHDLPALGRGAMRRRRLIDVETGVGGVSVWAMFRDTHVGEDGIERVLHEYDLEATVEAPGGAFVSCASTPRVLPWPECPSAAASAGRLVGRPAREVRDLVRRDLRGTTTCTHLNDLLRSLADVVPLARRLGVELS